MFRQLFATTVLSAALVAGATAAQARPRVHQSPLYRGAVETLDAMALRSDRIQEWLRAARAAQRGPRAACLHDMLSQSHAAERLGQHALEQIRRALEADDDELARAELGRLERAAERSRQVEAEASACGRPRR
jgi:hypothetical protein